VRLGVLVTDGAPEGGGWNFDADNRLAPPKNYTWPGHLEHDRDDIDRAVETQLNHTASTTWATTRAGALKQLAWFVEHHLAGFGPYEDAVPKDEWALHHSLLSPYLNVGLLHAREVIAAVLDAYRNGQAPIQSVEAFVRQVIGWREYINGMYWFLGEDYRNLNGLQADRDYVVRERAIKLLDPVTGRPAEGRVWSRGLQALVEMKEGCPLTPPTQVSARLSLQRFFSRYLHLSGMSGTLRECAGELRAAFGCRVVPVPRRLPSRLQRRPDRLFATDDQRRGAAVRRVRRLQRQGRPVLVATGSVQASVAMSQALTRAGIRHARLDARHDASEADVIARAGRAGAVTVATHMAGRGTDIALGEGVARLGGLHVLCCQDNTSARLDRQVIGRAGRQGEPGVAEVWRALDAKVWQPGPGWAGAVDRWVRARWLRAQPRRRRGR
jgi:hypothetical protein